MAEKVNGEKSGFIIDYISGIPVRNTPEESQAVQVFARILVEDYGYPKSHIQTRPQWRVKARPSDTKKEYPIDIAVFSDEHKSDDNLYIIVECKKKIRKDGRSQLEDYLRLSRATLGVWFNGEERLFLRKYEKKGKVLFDEIPNIPRYGERIEDIGKFKRKDLQKPHNLKGVFKAIRNHLAGNAVGTTRDEELARQLINIIFCKIYDEKFTKPNDMVSFRAGIGEDPADVADRIRSIFEKVKGKYKDVISESDAISLDDKSLVYVVGELQNYCLTDADRDAVADAFETFIGYTLKGSQGQFFTPRNVIRLLVEIVDPKQNQTILDPACGSGGFLVEGLKHAWWHLEEEAKVYGWKELALQEEKTTVAISNIHGIEKDEFLSRVAKAYMAIIGDGKGGIFCDDSLEPPTNWKSTTQQRIRLGYFDIILTNPPFGKNIKIVGKNKLSQFDLAYVWKKKRGTDSYVITSKLRDKARSEILFIERSLQFLKDGGILGIILPETFFHAPSYQYVMDFMRSHNIQWIIDLPHNTFRPHNNAKCIAIVLQKNVPQQDMVNMAVAEEMGHDHLGKPIFRWDQHKKRLKSEIWDDIEHIIAEVKRGIHQKYTFQIPAAILKETNIYVPRYYWQEKDKEIEEIAEKENLDLVPLIKLLDEGVINYFDGHGSPPAEYKGKGSIPYIRVKDIVNWEIYKDPTSLITEEIYEDIKNGRKDIIAEDILYVRRGSYRIGSVAIVSPFDEKVLLTREIVVLRVVSPENDYDITPYYLLYLLSHYITRMQTFNKVLIETTLPNIADRWQELKLPISRSPEVRKRISNRVKQIIHQKWGAIRSIHELEDKYGELTT